MSTVELRISSSGIALRRNAFGLSDPLRKFLAATLANVATLLGLLGTIFGLILAFEGVGAASAAKKQEVLAKGIAVAMNTTAFGLIVAIPTSVAHAVLSGRSGALLDTIEDSAMTLFNHLSAKNRAGQVKR